MPQHQEQLVAQEQVHWVDQEQHQYQQLTSSLVEALQQQVLMMHSLQVHLGLQEDQRVLM